MVDEIIRWITFKSSVKEAQVKEFTQSALIPIKYKINKAGYKQV